MSASVDRLGWMRLLWGTIHIDQFDWRDPLRGFRSLPKATIVTDFKSLFDLVSRTAMPSCEEFRTTLEVLLIKKGAKNIVISGGFRPHCRWLMR